MTKNKLREEKIIVIPEGKICDYIDGKFRKDIPEEYVRQTVEKRLVNEHKYSKDQIKVEFTLYVGSRKPRADLVIFPKDASSQTQEKINIIIECKNEKVEPNNRKDGVGQLQSYMSASVNCKWGMWTNGKHKFVFRKVTNDQDEIEFEEYNDIPSADGSIEDIDRPTRQSLKKASEDNLLFSFKTCHNHIYVNDGKEKADAFFELLKVIFCKIYDERNFPSPLEFYATSKERKNSDGQLSVKNRISKIFKQVRRKYYQIFLPNDEIDLQPRSLAYIVSELQKYTFLNTHIDIKGKAYEEIVGSNLRGDRGEFFTPRNVMQMVVEMVNPGINEIVLDPSCGTGGFLVTAMTHVIRKLTREMVGRTGRKESDLPNEEKRLLTEKIAETAETNYFGIDIGLHLVKATKMNMVMNNDGSGNILRENSLLHPHEWLSDFKSKLAESLRIKPSDISGPSKIGYFDIILTNPPFGSKIPVSDPHILEQYDLAHIWQKNGNRWTKTDRLKGSVPPEQLFIERCLQFLKPGGRIGIVLPDSILGSPGLGYIRQWLIKYTYIIASIDLHEDAFQPKNGTQTSILILQKKTDEEIRQEERTGQMRDYNIFMTMVRKIGHDKRGNILFKRDKHGNEILVEVERETENGTEKTRERIIDDQTKDIPADFKEWKRQEGIPW